MMNDPRETNQRAPSLRERKRAQTRDAIVNAALTRFARQGFDNTTVDQIAADAQISPRTFFHYFPSKHDVVVANLDMRLLRLEDALAGRPAHEPPLTAVRAALLEVAADFNEARELLMLVARITTSTPAVFARSLERQTHWEQVIAQVVADRLNLDVVEDTRPRLVAAVTLAAMRVCQQKWIDTGGHDDLPHLMAQALDLLERGLGTLSGTSQLNATSTSEQRGTP